jgi:hypothetical protein
MLSLEYRGSPWSSRGSLGESEALPGAVEAMPGAFRFNRKAVKAHPDIMEVYLVAGGSP